MLKAIILQEGRSGVEYEVADGIKIPNWGQKEFLAWTDEGTQRKMKVQVTEVNKALLSVPRIIKAGDRVDIDDDGSYIEDKTTGEIMSLREENGMSLLKVWVRREAGF